MFENAFSRMVESPSPVVSRVGALLESEYKESYVAVIENPAVEDSKYTEVFVLQEKGIEIIEGSKSSEEFNPMQQRAAVDVLKKFIPYKEVSRISRSYINPSYTNFKISGITIEFKNSPKLDIYPDRGDLFGPTYYQNRLADLEKFYNELEQRL
jgi:hypothetical protein